MVLCDFCREWNHDRTRMPVKREGEYLLGEYGGREIHLCGLHLAEVKLTPAPIQIRINS
jgi:hypothetical protein